MEKKASFSAHLFGGVLFGGIAYWLGGAWFGIPVFAILTFSYFSPSRSDPAGKVSEKDKKRYDSAVKDIRNISKPRQSKKSTRVLDTITFRYRDAEDNETERTVDLYTGIRGDKFRGYCHLRQEERTFYFYRIISSEVIRPETGEILEFGDWWDELRKMKRT